MYNEFSLCTKQEKVKICELAGEELVEFTPNWQYECLRTFEKVYEEHKLGSKSLEYSISQYLWKTQNFAGQEIDVVDPYIFDNVYRNKALKSAFGHRDLKGTLFLYITKYLDEKNENLVPPYDYLWDKLCLDDGNTLEEYLCFWIMRFILSSCYALASEYKGMVYSIDEYLLKTYEDMYYYTFLKMWQLYKNIG